MNVSVIGLGLMGLPMAHNLLKAGHTVTVYNRTRARSELLVAHGAHIADTIAEAARNTIVVTMLSDDPALESAVYGEGKLLESLAPDSIHLSMSTISAALSELLTEAHGKAGQHFIAAPVFGRPDAAAAAKLFVVAAGNEAALTRCQPVFNAVGQQTFVMGTNPVSANVVKLSGNFLIAVVIQSLGEAFSLIRKYDIDPDAYLDLLTNTLFAAPVYKNYGNLIAHQQYEPAGFKLPLGLKDVRLALAAAEAKNVSLPLGSLARDRLITALALGYENKDWASMAQIIAQNAGLE